MASATTVLVADDSATVRRLVARILERAGFRVVTAVDGIDAYGQALVHRPDVVVLDWDMPGCSGLDVLVRLKERAETESIAVVMLTAVEDRDAVRASLAAGATDYVRKPCDPAELAARVRNVARAKRAMEELVRHSNTDALTGLPNRRGMDPVFTALTGPAGRGLGVLVVDIDHFKAVNDTHGHVAGDEVLRAVAGRLSASAPPFTVSRWGGEEFVAAGRVDGPRALQRVGDRLRRAVAALPVEITVGDDTVPVPVTVSVGAAVADADDVDAALLAADQALFAAKDAGRNRVGLVVGGGVDVTGGAAVDRLDLVDGGSGTRR